MGFTRISVADLARLRADRAPHLLLDVREPHELEVCRFSDSLDIPMNQVPARLADLPRDVPIIVTCHHGGRSARVAQFLVGQGFADIRNLEGGIDAWAVQIDPEMERY